MNGEVITIQNTELKKRLVSLWAIPFVFVIAEITAASFLIPKGETHTAIGIGLVLLALSTILWMAMRSAITPISYRVRPGGVEIRKLSGHLDSFGVPGDHVSIQEISDRSGVRYAVGISKNGSFIRFSSFSDKKRAERFRTEVTKVLAGESRYS